MPIKNKKFLKKSSLYSASITREQFLFHEMRITAKLLSQGMTSSEIAESVARENLFQYPTEKSLRKMALACLRRLDALNDSSLVQVLASCPSDTAKQICLYAMMRQNRLVWDFMLTVVGEKFRTLDASFGKIDLNTFFTRLREQNDEVAAWSESTVSKVKQVLQKILLDNGYIDGKKPDHLNPVLIDPQLENAIRASGQEAALPAFNCLI